MKRSEPNYMIKQRKINKPTVKVGEMFDNKHSDDQVELTGYCNKWNLKVKFSDGRVGFGSVLALKAGTIKPIGEAK